MSQKKKGAGGKLNRSEIVQTRLSPKLRFAADLLARMQRRTVSSLIEGLIEQAIVDQKVTMIKRPTRKNIIRAIFPESPFMDITLKEIVEDIWSTEDADRFVGFAMYFPELLTYEESKMWEFITITPYFWEYFEINVEMKKGKVIDKELKPIPNMHGVIREHIREYWQLLNQVFSGDEPANKLKIIPRHPGRTVPKPDYYPPMKKVVAEHGN